MTIFREHLEQICDALDGTVAATVMGVDGLPVESISRAPKNGQSNGVEVDALLVEYSSLLDQIHRSAQVFAAGGLQEMSICSERLTAIFRLVTPDYFIAVALSPESNAGKARYILRKHAPALVAELS